MIAPTEELLPPRANPELLGHEPAERVLLRGLASGRLPHGWLITGPRGIGKATLAYRFARFLLAGAPAGGDLFGGAPESLYVAPDRPLFHRIAAGAEGDLRVVEQRTNDKGVLSSVIAVADVRQAVDFLHLTASGGGWRVIIVDPAEAMNPSAANALLKALEEPPPRTLLLLVSHAPGRLLPTLHSRCCRLTLEPLPEDLLGRLIERRVPGLAAPERRLLIGLSEGSIGRALALAAGGGVEIYRDLVALLAELPGGDVTRIHAFGERLARDRSGSDFRSGSELLLWWLARMIRSGSSGGALPEMLPGEAETAGRLLAAAGLGRWLDLWDRLSQQFARTDAVNLDRRQVLITAFLEIEALAA